ARWRWSWGERDPSPALHPRGRGRAPPPDSRAPTVPTPNAYGSRRMDRDPRRERRETDGAPVRRALSLARRVRVWPQARQSRTWLPIARGAPQATALGPPA